MGNTGLDSEADYPYLATDLTCDHTREKRVVATIDSFKDVPSNDEAQLQAAAMLGPVAVAIEADKKPFQTYKCGIFDDPQCGTKLDHGVLVVGVDAQSWKVKNSW